MQQILEKQKTQSRRHIYPSLSIRKDRLDRMLDMMLEYQTQIPEVLSQYEKAFLYAKNLGLGVNAGHDLDLNNLELFLSKVPADEVSIGHALISDALIDGLYDVTKQYLDLCK